LGRAVSGGRPLGSRIPAGGDGPEPGGGGYVVAEVVGIAASGRADWGNGIGVGLRGERDGGRRALGVGGGLGNSHRPGSVLLDSKLLLRRRWPPFRRRREAAERARIGSRVRAGRGPWPGRTDVARTCRDGAGRRRRAIGAFPPWSRCSLERKGQERRPAADTQCRGWRRGLFFGSWGFEAPLRSSGPHDRFFCAEEGGIGRHTGLAGPGFCSRAYTGAGARAESAWGRGRSGGGRSGHRVMRAAGPRHPAAGGHSAVSGQV